jgi:hypothetical protein
MLCRLLLVGGAALGGAWLLHKHHASLAALTPERAAIHGQLMANEHNPKKLEHMASVFGAEGLSDHAKALTDKAKLVRAQAQGAEALIKRARTGDQNAMGMIAAIREQAEAGSPRAQVSCMLMYKYCEQFPMQELGPLGELPVEDPGAAFSAAQKAGLIGSPFMSRHAA